MAEQTFADRLRELADWLETRPALHSPYFIISFGLAQWYAYDKAEAIEIVRQIGSCTKKSTDSFINFDSVEKVAGFALCVHVAHTAVCEKVVTEETVTEKVPVGDVVWEERRVTRQKVSWKCPDSLLSLGGIS